MNSDDWDARYATAGVWSREPNAWVAGNLAHLDPGTAVDLGAGEGRNALWLAGLGWEVTAVDFSPVGLETGRLRAAELGVDVEWVVADATTWVSPTLVDLVVIAYLQLPAADLSRAIGTAVGYLAPGGTLALINHDRDNIARGVGGPQDPAVLATVEELTAAASGLDIVECRQVERQTANGTAIDVVLVARAV
ncbi:MAG: class I SAM-dependent methyltransferase [Actinobacteria bacterium]|nr:class I SAM-dependent methyltransferase [Actinomycetota bacterium]